VCAVKGSGRKLVVELGFGQLLYCAAETIDAGFWIMQWDFDSALVRYSSLHPARIMANHRQAQSKRL